MSPHQSTDVPHYSPPTSSFSIYPPCCWHVSPVERTARVVVVLSERQLSSSSPSISGLTQDLMRWFNTSHRQASGNNDLRRKPKTIFRDYNKHSQDRQNEITATNKLSILTVIAITNLIKSPCLIASSEITINRK